jgi:hypothetical protein
VLGAFRNLAMPPPAAREPTPSPSAPPPAPPSTEEHAEMFPPLPPAPEAPPSASWMAAEEAEAEDFGDARSGVSGFSGRWGCCAQWPPQGSTPPASRLTWVPPRPFPPPKAASLQRARHSAPTPCAERPRLSCAGLAARPAGRYRHWRRPNPPACRPCRR